MIRVIGLFSCIVLLVACNTNNQGSNSTNDFDSKDTVAYTYNIVKENSQYFIGNTDESIDTTYFKITYPVFSQENVNENIKKFILIDGENTASEAAQAFIDGFDEFAGESNMEYVNTAWSKEVTSRVLLNTPRFITLTTQTNEYSGGAHGQHYTFFTNYDLQQKQPIQLIDILKDGKLEQLRKIAEKHFRNQENLTDSASLAKDFFFEDGIFALNDNFGLTKNSLIIYYNEYEIKPYSEGPTKLEIPYKDLADLFNVRGQEYIQSIL